MEQLRLVFVILVLLFSLFAVLVVPLPIKIQSKSNVEGNNLQETKAHVINKESLDKPEPLVLRFFQIPQKRDKQGSQGDVGNEGATKNGTEGDSKKGPDDYKDYEGSSKTDKKGDDPGPRSNNVKIGGGTPPTISTEQTVAYKYKTDYLGNWVYNPWGVTYGQMFRDTRFVGNFKWTDNNIYIDKHTMLYNPRNEYTKKVCRRASTGYNDPLIKRYLEMPFYHFEYSTAHILVDLRRDIFEKGKSEECHTPKHINWRIFNECQMMRHMRMEYLVPYYPMIQTHQDWDYDRYYNHRWPLDENPVWYYDREYYTPRWGDPTTTTTTTPFWDRWTKGTAGPWGWGLATAPFWTRTWWK